MLVTATQYADHKGIIRMGLTMNDASMRVEICHGLIEPKAADSAAQSPSSQLGHRDNLCGLWVRLRSFDYLGYKESQTSS